jgi:hypothetical protein
MRSYGEESVSAPLNALRTQIVGMFFSSFRGDLSQIGVRACHFGGLLLQ